MDREIPHKYWTVGKISFISIISILFLILVLYFVFYSDNKVFYIEKSQIEIYTVVKGDFIDYIPIDGTVYPRNSISIDAVQGGIIQEINVEDGQNVNKGDVLIKLQNADMELRFMEQETRIFDAINNLQRTQLNIERDKYTRQKEIVALQFSIDKLKPEFNRKQVLFNKDVIPLQEFEDIERDYKESLKQYELSLKLARIDSMAYDKRNNHIKSSIERMYNNLELLRKIFNGLYIKAPEKGKLSSFQLEMGQTVTPGQRIGQIDMPGGVLLKSNIDERYAARVFEGQKAEYKSNDSTYQMKISKVYTSVNKGVFQVGLVFTQTEPPHIKRGQSLKLHLLFSSPEDAVLIRRGGFYKDTGGNWIFVIDESGDFAERREIEIGRQNSMFYEVIKGLEPGERVIISSYGRFDDKDKLIFN